MSKRRKAEVQGAFGVSSKIQRPNVPQRVRMARKALSEFRHDGCWAWAKIEEHANAILKETPLEDGHHMPREYLNLSGHHKGGGVKKIYIIKDNERAAASATIDKSRWCGNCGRPLSRFAGKLCVGCYRLAAKEKMLTAVSMYRHWSDLYDDSVQAYDIGTDNTSYLYCLTKQPDFSDRLIDEISLEEELHGVPIAFRGGDHCEEVALQQQSASEQMDHRCADQLPNPQECARYLASSRSRKQDCDSYAEQDRALQEDGDGCERLPIAA